MWNLHFSGCICWLEVWLNPWLQTQTMKMMYTKVADALRDAGLSSYRKPTDYLNFYCLGARETLKPGEPAPLKPPDSNSRQVSSMDFLRFLGIRFMSNSMTKHQEKSDRKLDLPWLSYGYQKCMFVDSLTEGCIGPPSFSHYWVWSAL